MAKTAAKTSMRICATRTINGPCARAPRGFTLIELLLVVAIIAILIAVVVLSGTDGGGRTQLRAEAERLARLVELARDEALRDNTVWGVSVHDGRYGFHRFDHENRAWAAVTSRPFAASGADAAVSFVLESGFVDEERLAALAEVDGSAVNGATRNRLANDSEARPVVAIHPSGELTPFEVSVAQGVEGDKREPVWVLYTDGLAQVRVRAVDDHPTGNMADDPLAQWRN